HELVAVAQAERRAFDGEQRHRGIDDQVEDLRGVPHRGEPAHRVVEHRETVALEVVCAARVGALGLRTGLHCRLSLQFERRGAAADNSAGYPCVSAARACVSAPAGQRGTPGYQKRIPTARKIRPGEGHQRLWISKYLMTGERAGIVRAMATRF